MHGKDKIDLDLTRIPAADRSADMTSDDRRPGRHRAIPAARQRRPTAFSRRAPLLASTPVRVALAATVTCGLGFVAVAESTAAAGKVPHVAVPATLADRAMAAEREPASRSSARAALPPLPTASPASPKPAPRPTRPAKPRPVAGLTQAQMDNAATVVRVGRKLGLPRQGLIVAIATAMQESDLYNLASDVVPESQAYPHQGSAADYDSVGLFQQRPSTGWGAVADLMKPAYAAQKFFAALLEVSGWQQLSVTEAAQAVQASAFPDAYAQHEGRATTVVDALT